MRHRSQDGFHFVPETGLWLSDNTIANATTARHGLLPKLPGGTTTFLRADGAFATPSGSGGSVTGVFVGPDDPPSTYDAADDWFDVGTDIDTAGTRRSGATAWSKINTPTTAVQHRVLQLQCPASASDNRRMVVQALPSAPWRYQCRFGFDGRFNGNGTWQGGMVLRESATGKLHVFQLMRSSGLGNQLRVDRYSSPTTFTTSDAASLLSWDPVLSQPYFEIEHDGTNLIFRVSFTRGVFAQLLSIAAGSAFTTAADEIGLHVNATDSATFTIGVLWWQRVA